MGEKIDVLTNLGEFTGMIATQEECHTKGYWHRAVLGLIINEEGNILLQRRSSTKKLWSNKWDITVGGHVISGEFGRQALIRECEEELGLNVSDDEIKFLVSSISKYDQGGYVNNHFDECYLIIKNVDVKKIKLQKSEVSEIKFFKKDELLSRIDNNYDGITEKNISWSFVKKILESDISKQFLIKK